MPVGKSNRIVIDVASIELKRSLYAVLAAEGLTLKEWFESLASDYILEKSDSGAQPKGLIAEKKTSYKSEVK